MNKTPKLNPTVLDIVIILAGTIVYSLSVVIFIQPLKLPLGGVTGIALILNYLWHLPTGVMIIIMNIPLFLLSFRFLGRRFFAYTLVANLVSSTMLDVWGILGIIPTFEGEPLLGALYGGLFMGAGIGIIFSRGATTGGSDILSKIIQRRTGHSVARINLLINAVVIVVASVVYQSVEAALYAMIIQYVNSVTIDAILTGMDNSSTALIITHDPEGVAQTVLTNLHRGVTMLTGTGMYTRSPRATLLCVVRGPEVTVLKRMIMQQDPDAFLIMLTTREVLGKGFKAYGQ